MLKAIKWNVGIIISLLHLDPAFCYNPQLLESHADTFNDRIWTKSFISIKQIQENLDFLEDEKDESYIQQYTSKNVFSQYESKVDNASNEGIKNFFHNCKKIYEANEELDPTTQASVQMIFERVFQKYEQHSALLTSTRHLLPVIEQADDNDSKKDAGQIMKPGLTSKSLFDDLPSEYQKKVIIIINSIATNFFPEVRQGKLSLEELSSKCGTPLKELEMTYSEYLHSK